MSRPTLIKVPEGSLLTQWLPAVLIVLVIIFYFRFLYGNAINVPFADDIFDVLQVLSGVSLAEDKATAFQILFAQHNDHRTLASRLLYCLVYAISGEIDFRQLIFLANLALILLFISLFLVVIVVRRKNVEGDDTAHLCESFKNLGLPEATPLVEFREFFAEILRVLRSCNGPAG